MKIIVPVVHNGPISLTSAVHPQASAPHANPGVRGSSRYVIASAVPRFSKSLPACSEGGPLALQCQCLAYLVG